MQSVVAILPAPSASSATSAMVAEAAAAPVRARTVRLRADTLPELMRLPGAERNRVERWCTLLATVERPITPALERVAADMGVSFATARRKYDAWRRGGKSWQALADGRGRSLAEGQIDEATLAWFAEYVVANGRKIRAAWRAAVRDYRAGAPVPGVPAGQNRAVLPAGWSYENVVRRLKMSRFELTAARQGRAAASAYGPHVLTTRVGLAVGQRLQFDDMWHDFMVVRVGSQRPMRLLQLSAFDVFSACQFARGLKPRIEDPDTGQRLNLRESDMLFLTVHVLTDYGYHPDGCVIVVEHGTAALSEDLERRLFDLSGGKIRVVRSGIQRGAAFAGQYDISTGGNFRLKAGLESLHNLIHNETANLLTLPGQTGANSRTNLPAELAGRQKHLKLLMRVWEIMPPSVREQLVLPFVEERAACHFVEEAMEAINRRTEHELEGWDEAGLTTVDYQVPDLGMITGPKLLALPADQRAALQGIATPVARRLSPREVFDAGRGRLVRFRAEQAARLLYGKQSVEVTVRDGMLTFRNQAIAPGELRYVAHHWSDGDKFAVVVNPFSPAVAHLFDASGAWVGTAEAWGRVPMHDTEAIERQMGRRAHIERQRLQAVAQAGRPLTQRRMEEAIQNARVIRDHARSLEDAEDLGQDALMNAME